MQCDTRGSNGGDEIPGYPFPEELWEGFGLAVQRANNGMSRAAVIRQLIKWWMQDGPAPPIAPSKKFAAIERVKGDEHE